MTDQPPEDARRSKMTPEQKEQAKRRIAPLMQTLVDVNHLKLAVMEALAEAGPGGFDPQEMHRLLTDRFDQARKRFEIDLGMVKRMLAIEALRAAGHASDDGHVRLHAIDQKMVSMETATRVLQRQAREQAQNPDEPSDDLPRPR
jgi:hypothetical protein